MKKMTNPQNIQSVEITDIKMPFRSMVIFMLKWALAAIPATILLVVIVKISINVFSGVSAMMNSLHVELTTYRPPYGYTSDIPARCKGSLELEKCLEIERKLTSETPEQKKARQSRLEGTPNN
jgi:hypothetical protein